jgi:hypothetical protein
MTIILAPATPVELGLDARMAVTLAEMDGRCTTAVLAVDINSAHIATVTPEITAPLPLTPTAAPCPYSTPVAATLHRARLRLEIGGWCTGQLRDEQGAACLIGAIRAEAGSRGQADDACVVLLEAIRRRFPDAESVPSWNDSRRDGGPVMRLLSEAAALADARGI